MADALARGTPETSPSVGRARRARAVFFNHGERFQAAPCGRFGSLPPEARGRAVRPPSKTFYNIPPTRLELRANRRRARKRSGACRSSEILVLCLRILFLKTPDEREGYSHHEDSVHT
ncbi:hypothetical protein EVAR_33344_1 [Eumeta japonica]|uniref:Uncharacterized protein n=1 Tax=Eumeta variegata TaxID=151549 RepID=A0A4C1YIM7_EUMVA|nr:hypothetical protein EVAR_33344_1 [Eumeta japonica]